MNCLFGVPGVRLALATACLVSAPAFAQISTAASSFDPAIVNGADTPVLRQGMKGPAVLRAQVLLDRAGFGPGVIDGSLGASGVKAVRGFQSANRLPVTGFVDAATWTALGGTGGQPALARLAISADDAAGPFAANIPTEMADKAKLPALHYASLPEALAEKFHTTPAFLGVLNPGLDMSSPGTVIMVPNVRNAEAVADSTPAVAVAPAAAQAGVGGPSDWPAMLNDLSVAAEQPKAARVVVDKSDKLVRAYGEDGALIAQFPATIGSRRDPLPLGKWTIKGVARLPPFSYNPDLFWDAEASDTAAKLPPGPNSPVGVVWIDLSKKHYGIHGTPEPATIGRTESHGCIRLTNWDAARLAQMVSPNTPALLQN